MSLEKIKIRKSERVLENGKTITDITPLEIFISHPNNESNGSLTKDDVWGIYDDKQGKIVGGMIVARSEQVCPILGRYYTL